MPPKALALLVIGKDAEIVQTFSLIVYVYVAYFEITTSSAPSHQPLLQQ